MMKIIKNINNITHIGIAKKLKTNPLYIFIIFIQHILESSIYNNNLIADDHVMKSDRHKLI